MPAERGVYSFRELGAAALIYAAGIDPLMNCQHFASDDRQLNKVWTGREVLSTAYSVSPTIFPSLSTASKDLLPSFLRWTLRIKHVLQSDFSRSVYMRESRIWWDVGSEEFFKLECGCVEESHPVRREKAAVVSLA